MPGPISNAIRPSPPQAQPIQNQSQSKYADDPQYQAWRAAHPNVPDVVADNAFEASKTRIAPTPSPGPISQAFFGHNNQAAAAPSPQQTPKDFSAIGNVPIGGADKVR